MEKTLLLVLLLGTGRLLHADEIPAAQASSHAGETATVCGNVTGMYRGKPEMVLHSPEALKAK
jgi:hypothetical protein